MGHLQIFAPFFHDCVNGLLFISCENDCCAFRAQEKVSEKVINTIFTTIRMSMNLIVESLIMISTILATLANERWELSIRPVP